MIKKKKILVVGQTPPPYSGQAIMIDNMLSRKYRKIQFYHARMNFSSDMKDVGKFKLSKLYYLITIILKIYFLKIKHNVSILYYPPAGPHKIPMYRDLIVLNTIRWMFKEVIFHFHAAGISEVHPHLCGLIKKLYEKAYFNPDLAIRLSLLNPEDGKGLLAKKEVVIPNGIPDEAKEYLPIKRKPKHIPIILFVGALIESKGVGILIEAAKNLFRKELEFQIHFMGRFKTNGFQSKIEQYINSHKLNDRIKFLGVCTGKKKHQAFLSASMLCFPTFFESETFGLVLLEAMQFELPIIATKWRGIPDLVKDGENGLLIPIKDANALSDKIEYLIHEPKLRICLGKRGREIFQEKFTLINYTENIQSAFVL